VSAVLGKKKARFWRHAPTIGLLVIGSLSPALPQTQQSPPITSVKLAPPHIADIPKDDAGKQISLGRSLLAETKKLLPNNVGNALNCNSCHLNGENVALASPYFGVSVNYPRDNPRAGRPVNLRERINGCLLRYVRDSAYLFYVLLLFAPGPLVTLLEGQFSLVGRQAYSAKAGAEYLNRRREDVSDFIPADVVENRTDFGIFERAPQPGINYAAYPATRLLKHSTVDMMCEKSHAVRPALRTSRTRGTTL
jgi:hypothetical protein